MNISRLNEQQLQKMKTQPGFVAALDQSGGSTPKALAAYGGNLKQFLIVVRLHLCSYTLILSFIIQTQAQNIL